MTVSPGLNTDRYTAVLAWEPECGWTLTCSAPNRALARSMARRSAVSTCSHPLYQRAPPPRAPAPLLLLLFFCGAPAPPRPAGGGVMLGGARVLIEMRGGGGGGGRR